MPITLCFVLELSVDSKLLSCCGGDSGKCTFLDLDSAGLEPSLMLEIFCNLFDLQFLQW